MVGGLVRTVRSELAQHNGPWINTEQYSTPIYTVGGDQPRVRVTLDRSLPSLQEAIDAVPIPAGAEPAAGTDGQMVVWQPATDSMWEFWQMKKVAGEWHAAAAGAMDHVSTNPGHFSSAAWPGARPWWGATATGLPLVGGLITLDELRRGTIDHALAIGIPDPRAGTWSWPATHGDGDNPASDSLPEGAHLRLDSSLPIDSLDLPPVTRTLAEAAQRYGIVIRDRSGVVAFYGQDPGPGAGDPYPKLFQNRYPSELLAAFPWRRLQVLKLHLQRP